MALAAESWVNAKGRLPETIAKVVGSDVLVSVHFEYEVSVYGQGHSTTDVMAFTKDAVVAVEAKACESFGSVVWDWIDEDQANVNSPPHRCKVIAEYAQAFGIRVNIPRRSRGLYDVSRSKRLKTPLAWLLTSEGPAVASANTRDRNLIISKRFRQPSNRRHAPTPQARCTLLTKRKAYRRDTAVKVKLLLSPRQSRGITHFI
jgi:hypothetical protein